MDPSRGTCCTYPSRSSMSIGEDSFGWQDGLIKVALDPLANVLLELSGIKVTADTIRRVAADWASSKAPGMGDDWDDQFTLSLVAEALRFVGMTSLQAPKRIWFFSLACRALGVYLESHGESRQWRIDPAGVPMIGKSISGAVRQAIGKLLTECDSFSGQRATVCIMGTDIGVDAIRILGAYPWTAFISFDRNQSCELA